MIVLTEKGRMYIKMKVNRPKVESWVNKYKPKCQVCGEQKWDLDDNGVAFHKPKDLNLELPMIALTCHECGYTMLLGKNYFIN